MSFLNHLSLGQLFANFSILDAARDAAHATERKAAPITTYLMGVAAAQGANPQEIAAKIEKLAKSWPSDK